MSVLLKEARGNGYTYYSRGSELNAIAEYCKQSVRESVGGE